MNEMSWNLNLKLKMLKMNDKTKFESRKNISNK